MAQCNFDFTYLINKYSSDFVAEIPSEGSYNDMGRWVEGSKTQETLHGAIISHRQSKIFKSGGTITEKDMALYMLEPLKNSLQGAKIAYEGKYYSIGSLLENSKFTGVWAYNLTFVSAFDEGGENG